MCRDTQAAGGEICDWHEAEYTSEDTLVDVNRAGNEYSAACSHTAGLMYTL